MASPPSLVLAIFLSCPGQGGDVVIFCSCSVGPVSPQQVWMPFQGYPLLCPSLFPSLCAHASASASWSLSWALGSSVRGEGFITTCSVPTSVEKVAPGCSLMMSPVVLSELEGLGGFIPPIWPRWDSVPPTVLDEQ